MNCSFSFSQNLCDSSPWILLEDKLYIFTISSLLPPSLWRHLRTVNSTHILKITIFQSTCAFDPVYSSIYADKWQLVLLLFCFTEWGNQQIKSKRGNRKMVQTVSYLGTCISWPRECVCACVRGCLRVCVCLYQGLPRWQVTISREDI